MSKLKNSEKMLISLERQDLDRANKYFERALNQDNPEDLVELAQYLESIGFFPQAKRAYLKLVPSYPQAYISLAQIAIEDGQLEEAFAYLEEISPQSDLYVTALVVKADLYQLEGLPDVARDKLAEASHLSPEPLILFGLAEIDMDLGNFSQAIETYAQLDNRAIYEQTGVSTYQRIGLAYAYLGKFAPAIEFLEKALELEYDDETTYELASIFYDQEDYQKASIYFKQLDTISPDFEGYEYGYARSLHAEHKTDQALRISQQGLSKNPYYTPLLLLASQLSYELHDMQKAEDYLLQARAEADDIEEVALRLTNLYLEQERFDEVLSFEQEEIDNVLTKWNMARAYQALERLEEARDLYQELAADLAENPEFLEEYTYLLRELGQFDQAKEQAGRYLKLVADDLAMQDLYDSL